MRGHRWQTSDRIAAGAKPMAGQACAPEALRVRPEGDGDRRGAHVAERTAVPDMDCNTRRELEWPIPYMLLFHSTCSLKQETHGPGLFETTNPMSICQLGITPI